MALSRPAQLNLHAAAADGDILAITQLAESGNFNVNALDASGKRAIDHAAEKGQKEALVYLIEMLHASLDETAIEDEQVKYQKLSWEQQSRVKQPRYGVLHYAWQNSKQNALEIITYLIEKNVAINARVFALSFEFATVIMLSISGAKKSQNKLSQSDMINILRLLLQRIDVIDMGMITCIDLHGGAHRVLLSEAILRGESKAAKSVIKFWKNTFKINVIDLKIDDIVQQLRDRELNQYRLNLIQKGLVEISQGENGYPFDPEFSHAIIELIKTKLPHLPSNAQQNESKVANDKGLVSREEFARLEDELAMTKSKLAVAENKLDALNGTVMALCEYLQTQGLDIESHFPPEIKKPHEALRRQVNHLRFQFASNLGQLEAAASQSGVTNSNIGTFNTP